MPDGIEGEQISPFSSEDQLRCGDRADTNGGCAIAHLRRTPSTPARISQMKCLPALALLAALCAASSASAQVVTTGTYYEEEVGNTCNAPNINFCQITFTAVPQNLLVSDMSCWAQITGTVIQAYIGVSDTANNSSGLTRRNAFFPLPLQANSTNTTNYYAGSFRPNFLFGSGKWPTIVVATLLNSTITLNCRIVGTLQ
jgi:hypothetical protein